MYQIVPKLLQHKSTINRILFWALYEELLIHRLEYYVRNLLLYVIWQYYYKWFGKKKGLANKLKQFAFLQYICCEMHSVLIQWF